MKLPKVHGKLISTNKFSSSINEYPPEEDFYTTKIHSFYYYEDIFILSFFSLSFHYQVFLIN